jgi:hypothetical protein
MAPMTANATALGAQIGDFERDHSAISAGLPLSSAQYESYISLCNKYGGYKKAVDSLMKNAYAYAAIADKEDARWWW